MEVSLFQSSQIVMYDFGEVYVCFSSSAGIMFSIVGWSFGCQRDNGCLGASFIMPKKNRDLIFPKVVRAGYKIAINPKGDCPHKISF